MHCTRCNKEAYGILIQGHCRNCAEEKILTYDKLKNELNESRIHVDELIDDLRRLSIKNQSLKSRNTLRVSGEGRRGVMGEEDYKEFLEKLGKVRDSELAKKYDVSDSYVCRTRQKLEIPTYANNQDLWDKVDPVIFTKSIRAVAAEFGIDRGRVERRRKKLSVSGEQ